MLWKAFSLKGAQQSWKYLGPRHSFLRPIGTADFFFGGGVTPLQDKKQQHMLGLLDSFQITGQCCILSLSVLPTAVGTRCEEAFPCEETGEGPITSGHTVDTWQGF